MRHEHDKPVEIVSEPFVTNDVKHVKISWNGHEWAVPLSTARLMQRLQAEGLSDDAVDEVMNLVDSCADDWVRGFLNSL